MSAEEKEPQEETEQSAAINAAPTVWGDTPTNDLGALGREVGSISGNVTELLQKMRDENKEIAILGAKVQHLEGLVIDLIERNCLLKAPTIMADEPQEKGGIVA